MPSVPMLGKSLFLACCGSLLYFGDSDHDGNGTEAYSAIEGDVSRSQVKDEFESPSWIAPPKERKPPFVNGSSRDSPAEIDIKIKIPPTLGPDAENRMNSKTIMMNKTFLKGSHILQINIFNNGAPNSSPTIIKSQGALSEEKNTFQKSSEGGSRVLLSAGKNPSSNLSVSLPSFVSVSMNAAEEPLQWWNTRIFYHICPQSFKDTTGSGTGDLRGITTKLDYLKELGIGAVWISPLYVSPLVDFGYDVADFMDVDPVFGSLRDFDIMVKELHERDLKLLLDFIPNHSSDKHEWFQKSLKKIDPYTHYYVWEKPKRFTETGVPIPPNNWLSFHGGSAWEWSSERGEFYLHHFLKEEPDLKVRNSLVMKELDDILKFWLDHGVDGLRVDALKFLFEVKTIHSDEPVAISSNALDSNEYQYLNHTYSVNRPETVEAVKRWRKILDGYKDRTMMIEVYDDGIEEIMKYYGSPSDPLSHFPLNFHIITEFINRSDITGHKLKEVIEYWINSTPFQSNWPNWVLGSESHGRVASRLGKDLVDAFNMLALLLPGTPTTYYGEEIGMEDIFVTHKEAKDPSGLNYGSEKYKNFGRYSQRTPMQWDDTTNAGFSDANSTWLPVNPNYKTINVRTQQTTKQSHLKVYRELAKLRAKKTFREGNFSFPFFTEGIFTLKRSTQGEPSYLLVINTSENIIPLELVNESSEEIPTQGEVVIRSYFDNRPGTSPGSQVRLSSVTVLAGEGIVLKLN